MLGHFTTAEDVGQYSIVKMLLVLMTVLGGAFAVGLGPLVAERYARGDLRAMIQVMRVTTRYITLVTLPIFVIFLFWGAQLTPIFGPRFTTSQAIVGWLSTSQFVFLILGHAGWALSMTGKHVLELKILLVGLAVAVLFCWVAIPVYGQLGAAIATFASVAVANLARVLFVRRFAGAFPFGRDMFVIAAVGIGFGWASRFVVAQFSLLPIWNTFFGIGCFVLAYGLASWKYFLSKSEKSGIHGMARHAAHVLFKK